MFIAALFMKAKMWKQIKCPSMGEQINKLWYIHTTEYRCKFRYKVEWNTDTYYNMNEPQKHYA